jgi:ABC-type multidrug transport system fused ATPase/permease subunit
MLAYDYPLMSMFLSFLYFFLMILWIWIAIMVIIDIFRSHDMGGWAKALWLVFVIVLPYLGVFIYLIARGGKMAEHRQKDVEQAQSEFQQAVKDAGGVDTAGQLEKLAALKERGVLSDEEFAAQKAKLLA